LPDIVVVTSFVDMQDPEQQAALKIVNFIGKIRVDKAIAIYSMAIQMSLRGMEEKYHEAALKAIVKSCSEFWSGGDDGEIENPCKECNGTGVVGVGLRNMKICEKCGGTASEAAPSAAVSALGGIGTGARVAPALPAPCPHRVELPASPAAGSEYGAIKKACLIIEYDGGGINIHRTLDRFSEDFRLFIESSDLDPAELRAIDHYLATLSEEDLEVACCGEQEDQKSILVNCPPNTTELLDDWFQNDIGLS